MKTQKNKHQKAPRFDFFFSYWIFAWFILYAINITNYNPKIFIIGALLENVIYVSLMIYYKNSPLYIFLFIIANIIIKILPLWWVWNTEYKMRDLVAGIVLLMIYMCWVYLNDAINNNEPGIYKKLESTIDGIKQNVPTSPFTYYVVKYIGYETNRTAKMQSQYTAR